MYTFTTVTNSGTIKQTITRYQAYGIISANIWTSATEYEMIDNFNASGVYYCQIAGIIFHIS